MLISQFVKDLVRWDKKTDRGNLRVAHFTAIDLVEPLDAVVSCGKRTITFFPHTARSFYTSFPKVVKITE